jgi:diadenylate cyclase
LNKSLGTRQRAAIGLTEETDAVVVVVSEETGLISYAHKGNLVRAVSLEELRAFLTSVLVKTGKPQNLIAASRKLLGVRQFSHPAQAHTPAPAATAKRDTK